MFRSQDRVALVGQQPETEQRKVNNCLEISNNNIMKHLKEELRGTFFKDTKQEDHGQNWRLRIM